MCEYLGTVAALFVPPGLETEPCIQVRRVVVRTLPNHVLLLRRGDMLENLCTKVGSLVEGTIVGLVLRCHGMSSHYFLILA